MENLDGQIASYLLSRLKEAHPFRVSRLLLLLDLEHLKSTGHRVTGFNYVFMPVGFYIDRFPPFLESLPGVEKVVVKDEEGNPVGGFFRMEKEVEYTLPLEIRREIASLVEETADLDDQELNRLIMERAEYRKLLTGSLPGWT